MKSTTLSLISLFLVTALAGCDSKVQQQPFQQPDARAKSAIGDSFGVQSVKPAANQNAGEEQAPAQPSPVNVDKAKITIQKSALEKEFLLQSNMTLQEELPRFGGLKSRVVFFRQMDKKLYMIEASQGLLLPKDYPQVLPIAEFDVLSETEGEIVFDFNTGMSRLFISNDWRSRDGGEEAGYVSAKPAFSYISKARLTPNNYLEINQVALLELAQRGLAMNVPVEVAYYLKPYAPNPAFQPTVAPDTYDRMGFFEVAPQFSKEGGIVTYAAKMDISKPIVYAMSANTPPEYRDAVREGILYWNKAFGREVIKVVDAPKDQTTPSLDYNMVQWVEVDMAGFAYADGQMDPRTGEVLHHQIYFSSGWRRAARGEIKEYLKSGKVRRQMKPQISLAGFKSNSFCDMDINAAVAGEMGKIATTEQDEAKIQKASADLLREVVAHEVGHTLGLRHNFAGSLAANYPVDQREPLFKEYLNTGGSPATLVTASTVMDYQYPIESAMHGDQVLKAPKASAYDEKAIRALYLGEKFAASDLPVFCTDSHVGKYADCKPYDAGASYIEWMKYSGHHVIDNMPYSLFNAYIAAKAPSYGALTKDVSEVTIEPKIAAALSSYEYADLVGLLHADGSLISVTRHYPYVNTVNAETVRRETIDVLLADLARNGQFEAVMNPITPALADKLSQKFESLLQDPKMIRGTTVEGKPYEFTADELRVMKANARMYFTRLVKELSRVEVQVLNGEDPFISLIQELLGITLMTDARPAYDINELSQNFANYVQKRAEHYVLSTTGEPLVFKRIVGSDWSLPPGSKSQNLGTAGTPEITTLALPQFTYTHALRKAAAGLLRSERTESPLWGYAERIALGKAYENMTTEALPGIPVKDSGVIQNYPRELTKWILEAREVKTAINKP